MMTDEELDKLSPGWLRKKREMDFNNACDMYALGMQCLGVPISSKQSREFFHAVYDASPLESIIHHKP